MATRWICGFDRYDFKGAVEPTVMEVFGRETAKLFILDTDREEGRTYRQAERVLDYSSRLNLDDARLHPTREAAIDHQIKLQEDALARLLRKAEECRLKIEKLKAIR